MLHRFHICAGALKQCNTKYDLLKAFFEVFESQIGCSVGVKTC